MPSSTMPFYLSVTIKWARKHLKLIVLLIFLGCVGKALFCQEKYSVVHPSPNLGWSINQLNESKELYNGAVHLNIPLFNISIGNTESTASLSYQCKPMPVDQLPSWVGLGWNLSMGGYISRVVNGKPDEMRDVKSYTTITNTIYGSSPPVTTVVSTTINTDKDFAYVSNYSYLNDQNWNTANYIANVLATRPKAEGVENPIINIYPDNNYTVRGSSATIYNNFEYDYQPDEFMLNVDGVAAKFFLNHLGQWICESNIGNYKIEPKIAENKTRKGLIIPRLIYGFKVTAPNGVIYHYGANENDINANIEYWRGPHGTGTGPSTAITFDMFGNSHLQTCPSAWYLSKIEYPNSEYVTYQYKVGKLQMIYGKHYFGEGTGTSIPVVKQNEEKSIAEPLYLTSITYSNGFKMSLASEDSKQLGTDIKFSSLPTNLTGFYNYPDIAWNLEDFNNMQKLTEITLSFGSTVVKRIRLNYYETMQERLKLKSISQVNDADSIQLYRFEYETQKLPPYAAGQRDHFGYYNNKSFPSLANVSTRAEFETIYMNSRQPDFQFSTAESLRKVFFPTGGSRELFYEPNDYSSMMTTWPFNVSPAADISMNGGFRVRKIIDRTEDGNIASEREFIYKTAIDGNVSSGILSVDRPVYTLDNSGTNYYWFDSKNMNPFDRSVSPVTYTTVFEKNSSGGYKKNVFYNFDNGKGDAPPLYESGSPSFSDRYPYTRNAFKRGLLKELLTSDLGGLPKIKTSYRYQDELENGTRYIRAIRLRQEPYRASAYPIFYYPNVLREENSYEYGTSQVLEKKMTYEYNTLNLVKTIESKNSLNQDLISRVEYPSDLAITNDPTGVYQEMVGKNMINYVVRSQKLKGSISNQLVVNNYAKFGSNILVESVDEKRGQGETVKREKNVKYNAIGRPLEVIDMSGNITVYIWGYLNQCLIAKVIGRKTYDQVLSESGINTNQLTNPLNIRKNLNLLYSVPGVQVTTYTHAPFIGILSETNPSGLTVFYQYDNLGRLSSIWDDKGALMKKICYNYAGNQVACDNLGTNPVDGKYNPNWTDLGLTCDDSGPENSFTGYMVMMQRDVNPFSPTYDQYRLMPTGIYDLQACPAPCSTTPECSSGDPKYKCIYGLCEEGVKVYTFSECQPGSGCECTYHYEWSDGSQSQDYTVIETSPCI